MTNVKNVMLLKVDSVKKTKLHVPIAAKPDMVECVKIPKNNSKNVVQPEENVFLTELNTVSVLTQKNVNSHQNVVCIGTLKRIIVHSAQKLAKLVTDSKVVLLA